MAKVLIVYATRTGETEEIGNIIAEGLRITGVEVTMRKITEIKNESELNGYDGYVFGAPTYHGDMIQGMKTFLFLAEKADLKDKVGAAFGAFGWSGEAPDRIFDTMKNIYKMKMVSGPMRLKSASLGGGLQMAHDYGKEIAAKIGT
jgi:flavorubredoxin